MADILYIHPYGHLNDFIVPAGAISVMNAIPGDRLGRYAHELTPQDLARARVVLLDWHWSLGLAGLRTLTRAVREENPRAAILVGGITASAWAPRLLNHLDLDGVVQGDAEVVTAQAVERVLAGRGLEGLPNLWVRPEEPPPRVRMTQAEFAATDTLSAPWFPSYTRLLETPRRTFAVAPWLIAIRGCVMRCEVCYGSYASAFGPGVRARPPENLAAEVTRASGLGHTALRIFFGRPAPSALRRYLQALASTPTRFADGVGLYLCTVPEPEDLALLRQAFPSTVVTISLLWPGEIQRSAGRAHGDLGLDTALVHRAVRAAGRGLDLELWYCQPSSRAAVESCVRGVPEERARAICGYVWNLPRPNERAVARGDQTEEEQWSDVEHVSHEGQTYHFARALSAPLARLLAVFADLDELDRDPETWTPPDEALSPFWAVVLDAWRRYHYPVLTGLRFRWYPMRLAPESAPWTLHAGPAPQGSILADLDPVDVSLVPDDPGAPILRSVLPPLPRTAGGWALLPHHPVLPRTALESDPYPILAGRRCASGARVTLRRVGVRVGLSVRSLEGGPAWRATIGPAGACP